MRIRYVFALLASCASTSTPGRTSAIAQSIAREVNCPVSDLVVERDESPAVPGAFWFATGCGIRWRCMLGTKGREPQSLEAMAVQNLIGASVKECTPMSRVTDESSTNTEPPSAEFGDYPSDDKNYAAAIATLERKGFKIEKRSRRIGTLVTALEEEPLGERRYRFSLTVTAIGGEVSVSSTCSRLLEDDDNPEWIACRKGDDGRKYFDDKASRIRAEIVSADQ